MEFTTKAGAISPTPTSVPAWALRGIFAEASGVAWEGEANPLVAKSFSPSNTSFSKKLPQAGGALRWHECIHPLDRKRVHHYFDRIRQGQAAQPAQNFIDYRLIATDGEPLWIRHSITRITRTPSNSRTQKTKLRGFIFDIEAEKNFQLESLRAGEREQKRISQDLHDDICQILTGVSCFVQASAGRISKTAPDEAERLLDINTRIIDAMNRARAICHGLHPDHLVGANIHETINELARQSATRFPLKIRKKMPAPGAGLPLHTREQLLHVYRIAQEAVCNAVRHGEASEVTLRLARHDDNGTLRLEIEDNGRGLPARVFKNHDGANADTNHGGMGLHIMRYRASQLGGELALLPSSRNDSGALVRLTYSPAPII